MSDREPKRPDEEHARVDYASIPVSPVAYVIQCPACANRYKTEKTIPQRCPECNKAVVVSL